MNWEVQAGIYLDNAATSFPKPEAVYRAVDDAMRRVGANPGRGGYRLAMEADRIVYEAREAIAGLFGIADSARVIFTANATEALNLALKGLVEPGCHVVTSSMEHNAVTRPLHTLEMQGISVTRVPCAPDGTLDPAAVEAALRPNTRLLAFTHASNVTGTINPVEALGRMARRRGIPLLVDAAQSAGTLDIDVQRDGITLLACPGHKGLLGPQGTGFLYVAPGYEPRPLKEGGTGSHSESAVQPADLPDRYESGTLNMPGIAGLKAGVEYVAGRGTGALRAHEMRLVSRLLEGLASIPGVVLYGPRDPHRQVGVVSFTIEGLDPADVGALLAEGYGIMSRVGLHCAPDAHRTIGSFPAGTVRLSPGPFNSEEEMDCVVKAVRAITGARASAH